MADPKSWWLSAEVIAALLGVLAGFLLGLSADWWRGRSRRRAHWAALSAEMDYCRDLAETYLRENVAAPLYRLPTVAYTNSLPALLQSAALNDSDVRNLLAFFNEVETLNRGMDQADRARLIPDTSERDATLHDEYGRNRLKAERLVPIDSRAPSYYDRAKSVVEFRRRWYRLK
jgi:hypothetical protein